MNSCGSASEPISVTDGLVAGRVADRGSATRGALDDAYATVNVLAHGADPTGSDDSASAFQAALNAVADGGKVLIPAGIYRTTATSTNAVNGRRKNVRVLAYGARILSEGPRVFDFAADYEDVYTIAAALIQTAASSSGRSATVTAILNDTPPWSPGDVVRLVADDILPETRPPSGGVANRAGQFLTVDSINESTVTFRGHLRDRFTTNVRCARLPKVMCMVKGPDFGYTAAAIASQTFDAGGLVNYHNLTGPVQRDVTMDQGIGPGFQFAGCYGYTVENTEVGRTNNTENGAYGYGIMDCCSHAGRILGCRFRRLRHGVTTASPAIKAGATDLGSYGRSYGGKVSDCVGEGTYEGVFDTHADADSWTFSNCHAHNATIGFNLRGRNSRVVNSHAESCFTGLSIGTETIGTQAYGHQVSGVRITNPGRVGVLVDINPAGSPAEGQMETRMVARFENVNITEADTDPYLNHAVQINNAVVALSGLRVTLREGRVANGSVVQLRHSMVIQSTGWIIDVAGHSVWDGTGAAPPENGLHIFQCYNDDSPLDQDGGTVRNKIQVSDLAVTGTAFTLVDACRGSGRGDLIQLRHLEFEKRPPGTMIPNSSVDGSFCEFRAPGKNSRDNDGVSSAFLYSSTSNGTHDSWLPTYISQKIDPILHLQAITNTVEATLPALPVGRFLGQEMVIYAAGNQTTTVQHGGNTVLKAGSNTAMVSGSVIRLVWLVGGPNGRAWFQVA